MAQFAQGQFKNSTGYLRQRLGKRNIQSLTTSGEIDDELWILLEYYSEIVDVGLNYLKQNGIGNTSTRKKTFKHFQAHIRQAKSYYYSAKSLPTRSSGLLYYYCFLNLAKAALVVRNPSFAGKKIPHGLEYRVNDNSEFNRQTINIKANGVFIELYNWYFGQAINAKQLSISRLLDYCTDISYQCQIAGKHEPKILYCYYAHCVDKGQKIGWSLIGIPEASTILKYKKNFNGFLNNFEKIEIPQLCCREIFDINALQQGALTFFQSKATKPWPSENITSALEVRDETMKAFGAALQVNYFASSFDFQIALPYTPNKQIIMDEAIAIYIVMFYLSNLVRYKPQYLESLLSKKEAWLIDSFIKSCSITFLRVMVSRIIGIDYILERR